MIRRVLITVTLCTGFAGCNGGSTPDEPATADANSEIAASVPSTDIVLVSLPDILQRRDPGKAIDVAVQRGYDNQPAFSDDGRSVLFSRIDDGAQSDVYRFDLQKGATVRVTRTAESEYSPTPLAGGGFSCIQVAMDGTQRLWAYSDAGAALRTYRKDITGVGYHAWLEPDQLALFIVAEPMRLEIAATDDQARRVVATNIGRSIQRTSRDTLAYVQFDDTAENEDRGVRTLIELDLQSGRSMTGPVLPGAGEDLAWLADGSALIANARTLYRLAPGATQWEEWVNLARSVHGDISRMAVDPTGQWLALVVSESE